MIRRTHKTDKKSVLIHELGHFLCGLRGACRYCPDDIQKLLDGKIHIEDDNGYYAREEEVTYDDINKLLIAGGAFMAIYFDGENTYPRKVKKSRIDYEAWLNGANSDLTKMIDMFGEYEMYKAFRTLKEWIGPYDIECIKELYIACEGKDDINCMDLEPILSRYYYQVRLNKIRRIKAEKAAEV